LIGRVFGVGEDEWGAAASGKIHHIATDYISKDEFTWSSTEDVNGRPFQKI
jgi:hypothetical protein